MGRIYEVLRPHISEFCDMVDPADLMRQLPQLRPCDLVGLHVVYVLCCIYLLQYIIVFVIFVLFLSQTQCCTVAICLSVCL